MSADDPVVQTDPVVQADRVARELARLHERAMDGLRGLLVVHEKQERAVMRGAAGDIHVLAALEDATTRRVAAVEWAIRALEASARFGREGASRPEAARLREEHDSLRSLVLERNRAVRRLLGEQMEATRRELTMHRSRMGTPSPYAAIGEATLLDIRT